jgi:DNA-directed RNA polymerase I and III subunit RPAC1
MAIENVYIWINNSIMQDEVLAHRLGLIPIKADPRWFEWIESPTAEPTDRDTIVFRLDVVCEQQEGEEQKTMTVYSDSLEWMPQGGQDEQFAAEPIKPVYDNIIIAKLRPGQQIALEAHCRKGVGKDHAKYSPVSTASYRLLPEITVTDAVQGELADELIAKCPMNVFDIEDLGGGRRTAVAARPRDCTVCRECIREDGWSERVKLGRVADHFIFQVESTGILPPEVLVSEALAVLKAKCEKFVELAAGAERNVGYEDTEEA